MKPARVERHVLQIQGPGVVHEEREVLRELLAPHRLLQDAPRACGHHQVVGGAVACARAAGPARSPRAISEAPRRPRALLPQEHAAQGQASAGAHGYTV